MFLMCCKLQVILNFSANLLLIVSFRNKHVLINQCLVLSVIFFVAVTCAIGQSYFCVIHDMLIICTLIHWQHIAMTRLQPDNGGFPFKNNQIRQNYWTSKETRLFYCPSHDKKGWVLSRLKLKLFKSYLIEILSCHIHHRM